MSWAALSSDTVSVAESPLETRRFGLDVARVNVGLQADIEVERLAGILEELSTDLAIVRYPASKVTWAHTLANRLDGVVFHADTLIYWHLALSGRPIPDPVQGATSDLDPESVASSVGRIFADYSNHYSANPRLNDRLALDGYQEWAANSASAGNAITLVSEGETIAVATVEAGDGYLEILLAGVEPNRQGRGESCDCYRRLNVAPRDSVSTRSTSPPKRGISGCRERGLVTGSGRRRRSRRSITSGSRCRSGRSGVVANDEGRTAHTAKVEPP